MINEITSISDVEYFFNYLINEESLNFHPDEDFRNYIHLDTDLPSYVPEEADHRNKLMEACFKVCNKENADIYQIGIEMLLHKLQP